MKTGSLFIFICKTRLCFALTRLSLVDFRKSSALRNTSLYRVNSALKVYEILPCSYNYPRYLIRRCRAGKVRRSPRSTIPSFAFLLQVPRAQNAYMHTKYIYKLYTYISTHARTRFFHGLKGDTLWLLMVDLFAVGFHPLFPSLAPLAGNTSVGGVRSTRSQENSFFLYR